MDLYTGAVPGDQVVLDGSMGMVDKGDSECSLCVTGALCREANSKVATAPNTQSRR